MATKRTVFIDASPLIHERMSGVGHMTLELIQALDRNQAFTNRYKMVLIVPLGKMNRVKRWQFQHVHLKSLGLPLRVANVLNRKHLLPPIDTWLGRGVYIFPNFSNFPLAFSRSITYIHDLTFTLFPDYVEPKNQAMLAGYATEWMQRSDIIATVSETAKNEIIEQFKIPARKIGVVYNGIKPDRFNQLAPDMVKKTEHRLGIVGKYLLFVGNIEPRKNIEGLIAAYHKLPKKVRQTHSLVLVGGGGWNNQRILQAIADAQAAGERIITPQRYVADDEIAALMAGATAFVLPSFYEGFGIPPLEALAAGTPIVVSDIPVLREIFGGSALYADRYDPAKLAKQLDAVLSDTKQARTLVRRG